MQSKLDDPVMVGSVPGGLFSSQLDLVETKSHRCTLDMPTVAPLLPRRATLVAPMGAGMEWGSCEQSVSVGLRHARWQGEREDMARAIWRATHSTSIVQRFLCCGEAGQILISKDGQRAKVESINCRSRFCEPCLADRGWHVKTKLLRLMGDEYHRFLTVTLAETQQSLVNVREHLQQSIANLRRSLFWKQTVTGGAAFTEITRGRLGTHWHVHAHMIVRGTYIDWKELREAWRTASGGSYIVDVEAVKDKERGAKYVADYSTKGIGRELTRWPDRLVEAIQAIKGSRLIGTFGDWWGVDLEQEEPDPIEWCRPVLVEHAVSAAVRGEPWAVGVMLMLKRQAILRRGVLVYRRSVTE